MPQQQTSSNAILRSWRGLLAARPRASLPLGVPGRLLREFAQQLVVLCHDLFCNGHLRLKLPAAWEKLNAGRSAERYDFEFCHSHLPPFSRQ
jgi:hypothetical protein